MRGRCNKETKETVNVQSVILIRERLMTYIAVSVRGDWGRRRGRELKVGQREYGQELKLYSHRSVLQGNRDVVLKEQREFSCWNVYADRRSWSWVVIHPPTQYNRSTTSSFTINLTQSSGYICQIEISLSSPTLSNNSFLFPSLFYYFLNYLYLFQYLTFYLNRFFLFYTRIKLMCVFLVHLFLNRTLCSLPSIHPKRSLSETHFTLFYQLLKIL